LEKFLDQNEILGKLCGQNMILGIYEGLKHDFWELMGIKM